ncbi:MAG: hypothetical protein KC422_09340 [Trueperaceae bacterium]|nr:hypothetical protein [Trueperaceae bacterium]
MPKVRYKLGLLLIFGFLTVLAFAQDKEKADYGLSVYKSYYCGLCHQDTAAESQGIFGPNHDAIAVIAQARILDPHYSGKATTVEDYLRESVLEPEAYLVPGFEFSRHRMPSYKHMSEEELDALIFFLLHQQEVVPAQ